jgi:hypothetical protein
VSTAVDPIVPAALKASVTGTAVLEVPRVTDPKFTVACAITVVGTASDDATSTPRRVANTQRLDHPQKTSEAINSRRMSMATDSWQIFGHDWNWGNDHNKEGPQTAACQLAW